MSHIKSHKRVAVGHILGWETYKDLGVGGVSDPDFFFIVLWSLSISLMPGATGGSEGRTGKIK